jgi:hypothetical protein
MLDHNHNFRSDKTCIVYALSTKTRNTKSTGRPTTGVYVGLCRRQGHRLYILSNASLEYLKGNLISSGTLSSNFACRRIEGMTLGL